MRLVRLGEGTSEVGVDVRAALASWSRGDTVVGGIALAGCQPPGCPHPVDAVLVLPRGILVVVGVDLPDPALRLDAPLAGLWKTDGWPLVRGDGAVNPATEALGSAAAIAAHLERSRVEPLPVGIVVAVGPYVGQVFQPTADLQRGVRILHPEPMTLLTATRELAVYQRRCSVAGARAILDALDHGLGWLEPADLVAEGFTETVTPDLAAARTTVIPRVGAPDRPAPGPDRSRSSGRSMGGRRSGGQLLRWLPVGAAILVALLLITGIVFAVASAGSGNAAAGPGRQTQPTGVVVDGVTFEQKGLNRDANCAAHAYGDLQVWLQHNPCVVLIRLRYESTSDNQRAALLVAVLRFADSTSASQLRAVADKPGSGAVSDVSAEGVGWPDGTRPTFDSAAYLSGREGNSVRLVQAVWLDRPSTPDDPALKDLATRALQLPVED